MFLKVQVQAPDQTHLSWKTHVPLSLLCLIPAAALGSTWWNQGPIQSICLSVAKLMEPTFAARLSHKNKYYKWENKSSEMDLMTRPIKQPPHSSSNFSSKTCQPWHFQSHLRHFQASTVVSAAFEAAFFPSHSAEVWFQFGRWCPLFQAYYLNRCQCAMG